MTINISDKILYLGAGCGLGMIIGALFAPRSGQETRETLSNKVDDISHKVQERIQSAHLGETASQTWQNVVQTGRNVASIARRRVNSDVVEPVRNNFNQSMEEEDLFEH
jgi:gas vesicle protein